MPWAIYLAASWTWCIGMYLPALLLRDHGSWSFLAFAIPNCVGAAAMGHILTSRQQSERLVRTHAPAIAAFTLITVAFHAFFLPFFITSLPASLAYSHTGATGESSSFTLGPLLLGLIPGLVVLGAILAAKHRLAAGIAFAVSLVLLTMLLLEGSVTDAWQQLRGSATWPSEPFGALWLAPVMIFGFALCPYLDVTFHHARQGADKRGAFAFTVGFCILFLIMIIGTLLYGPALITNDPSRIVSSLLTIHITTQVLLTVGLHVAALNRHVPRGALLMSAMAVAVGAITAIIWLFGFDASGSVGEIIYRIFLSCYGLAFPVYVWVAMIPTRDGHAGLGGPQGRAKAITVGITIIAVAPFYWFGFIEHNWPMLAPGLAISLLARLPMALRYRTPGDTPPSSQPNGSPSPTEQEA